MSVTLLNLELDNEKKKANVYIFGLCLLDDNFIYILSPLSVCNFFPTC